MGREEHLDGMRGLAAMWVVFSHAWLEVWPVYYNVHPIGWTARLTGWLLFAHFAVDIFIVLSGYCLMLPVSHRGGELIGGARLFFWKRARRILPPFYLALALCTVLCLTVVGHRTGTHWDTSIPISKRGLFVNLTLFQDVFHRGEINGVVWSIAVEWRIYFLFPAIVIAFSKVGPSTTTMITVVAAYVAAFALRHTIWEGMTLHYVALFGMGCLAARLSGNKSGRRFCKPAISIALAAFVGFICAVKGWQWASDRFIYLDFPVGVATAVMLIHTSANGKVRKFLSFRPFVVVGTFAYSLYLIHAPILQVAWQISVKPLGLTGLRAFLMLLAVGVPMALVVSFCFYRACERPFMSTHAKRGQERELAH
jgi:peptidoglycan/LPS O-acetylase OafA/YrhL